MSVPRLDPVRSSVPLPETSALDGLDAAALVEVAEQAAALHAGAMARLTGMGRGRVSGVADDDYMTIDDAWQYRHPLPCCSDCSLSSPKKENTHEEESEEEASEAILREGPYLAAR